MAAPEGITEELKMAWENAWSAQTDGTPHGTYIGAVKTEHTTFYFYKDGTNYWYENDYDREMRAKQEAKRKQKLQQQNGSRYGGYYGSR